MFNLTRKIYRAPADEGTTGGGEETTTTETETTETETTTTETETETETTGGEKKTSLVSDADGEEKKDGEETETTVEPLTTEDITLPEGTKVDEAALGDFLTLMNDTEISPAERAQKLIDLQLNIAEEAGKASQALWDKTQDDWQAEALALPEIGGDNLPKTLANIKSGLDKLGATEETYAALNFTGAGNHPAIISILSKATAHLVEGQPTKEGTTPAKGNLSQADRIYGGKTE